MFFLSPEISADWAGTQELRDGIRNVWNPSEPSEGHVAYTLQERWRLASETETGEVVFAVIESMAEDEAGNLYLLDTQLKTVHVVSPQGAYVRAIGRAGEGPGEFGNPTQVFMDEQGRLGVVDIKAMRVQYFTTDGVPLASWKASIDSYPGAWLAKIQPIPGGSFAARIVAQQRSDTELHRFDILGVLGPEGDLVAELVKTEEVRYRGEPFCYNEEYTDGLKLFCVSRDGHILLSQDYDAFKYWEFDPDGSLVAVVERAGEPSRRSPDALKELEAYWKGYFSKRKELRLELSPFDRSLHEIIERGDGALWVRTGTGTCNLRPGVAETVDVYDRTGRFVQCAVLEHEFSEESDFLFLLEERVVIATGAFSAAVGAGGASAESGEEGPGSVPLVICCEPVMRR